MPPRVFTSGPKPCWGQKKLLLSFDIETIIESNTLKGVGPLLQELFS